MCGATLVTNKPTARASEELSRSTSSTTNDDDDYGTTETRRAALSPRVCFTTNARRGGFLSGSLSIYSSVRVPTESRSFDRFKIYDFESA